MLAAQRTPTFEANCVLEQEHDPTFEDVTWELPSWTSSDAVNPTIIMSFMLGSTDVMLPTSASENKETFKLLGFSYIQKNYRSMYHMWA